jgi:hypothetical protein
MQQNMTATKHAHCQWEAQESTKLPAGASYTCPVQGINKEKEELDAATRLRGSGDNNDDCSNGQ